MPTYKEWMPIISDEKKLMDSINQAIQEQDENEAYRLLNESSLDLLILFTEHNSAIATFCQQPKQEPILLRHLKFFNDPQINYQARTYEPLTVYQTLKGRYFFNQVVAAKRDNNLTDTDWLSKSAAELYYCYYALDDLITQELRLLAKDKLYTLSNLQKYTELAATYHWTPGYILRAEVYYICGKKFQNALYFAEVFKCLLIARTLAEYPNSKNAINDAYFGEPLAQVLEKRPFLRTGDLDKIIQQFNTVAKLDVLTINKAYKEHDEAVAQILKTFPAENTEVVLQQASNAKQNVL